MQEKKYFTRMGDGSIVHMTEAEIREDMKAGMEDAVSRGKISPLTDEEFEHLYEIITMPGVIVGVEPGKQVVTTSDSGSDKINTKCGIPTDRAINAMLHERIWGATRDIGYSDYNFKTVKGVAKREASVLKHALNRTTMPLFYGAMPNLVSTPSLTVRWTTGSAFAGRQDKRSHGSPGRSGRACSKGYSLCSRTDA